MAASTSELARREQHTGGPLCQLFEAARTLVYRGLGHAAYGRSAGHRMQRRLDLLCRRRAIEQHDIRRCRVRDGVTRMRDDLRELLAARRVARHDRYAEDVRCFLLDHPKTHWIPVITAEDAR
jgi:hypothetical protein